MKSPTRDDMVPGANLMHSGGAHMVVVGEKRIGRITTWVATIEADGSEYTILPTDLPRYYLVSADENAAEA